MKTISRLLLSLIVGFTGCASSLDEQQVREKESAASESDAPELEPTVEPESSAEPEPVEPEASADEEEDADEEEAGCPDADGDGLCDEDELAAGTDVDDPDSDDDGLSDGDEMNAGTDPLWWDSDNDGLSDEIEVTLGLDPLERDSDGDGLSDGDEQLVGTNPTVADEACVVLSHEASSEVSPPVDIIIAIDSSGSMDDEIAAVESNINTNLAGILGDSQVDYRIILLARYGDVCISSPLSNDSCNGNADEPQNSARFFHYDSEVDSHDALAELIATLDSEDQHGAAPNGWRGWLRPEADKTFLLFSDDEPDESSSWFDTQLLTLAPEQFGDAENRRYTFHSIIGVTPNSPPTTPWPSTAPIKNGQCAPGSESSAPQFQELSVLTGGMRFPLCFNENFDLVFQEIAQGVVDTLLVPCRISVPTTDSDADIDLAGIAMTYINGEAGVAQSFLRVSDEAACAADGFFTDGNDVVLCPAACSVVQADISGQLDVHFACVGDLKGG